MPTMDANPLFIDTNILIYANVATAPFHEQALNAIKAAHQAERPQRDMRLSALGSFHIETPQGYRTDLALFQVHAQV